MFNTTVISIMGYQISHKELDPSRFSTLKGIPLPQNKSLSCILGLFANYSKWVPLFSHRIRLLTSTFVFPLSEEASKTLNP